MHRTGSLEWVGELVQWNERAQGFRGTVGGMVNVKLSDNERLLGKGECALMVGPLSVAGVLVLTSDRLYFEPSRLNRMVGIKALTLKIGEIDDTEVMGIDRVVQVYADTKIYRFMGKWARTVHGRVQALLDGEDLSNASMDGFAVDERYLVQTSMDYSATAVIMVGGDLTITTRSVLFTPSSIERLMWRKLKVETRIEEVEDLKLDGSRKVSFRVGKKTHRFSGTPSREVYAALWAAKEHASSGRDDRDLIFEVTNAATHRGVLSHPGLLVETWTGLTFLVSGALDKLVGVPQIIRFAWSEVQSLDLTKERRLVITTEAGKQLFSTPKMEETFEELLPAFSRVGGADAIVLDPESGNSAHQKKAQALVRELTDTWGGRLPDLTGDTLALYGPAVRVSRKVGTRRGHVALFDEYVVWFPEGGVMTGVNPIVVPIGGIHGLEDHEGSGPELSLHQDGAELRLIPASRERFTRRFLELIWVRATEIANRDNKRGKKKESGDGGDVWNRRATYRVELPARHQVAIQIRVLGAEKDQQMMGRLTDLSMGGAGVATGPKIEVGKTVHISIERGDDRISTLEGVLIHSRRVGKRQLHRSGIEFSEQTVAEAEELREIWTTCQRIEVQIRRGLDETDIDVLDGESATTGRHPSPEPPEEG